MNIQTHVSAMTEHISSRERRRGARVSVDLPLEYRKVGETICRGAYTGDVSRTGLLIYCIENAPVGAELEISIFYPDEYRFTCARLSARIVRKQPHVSPDWKGYKYGLAIVRISPEDRGKLEQLIGQGGGSEEAISKEVRAVVGAEHTGRSLNLDQRVMDQRVPREKLMAFLVRHFEKIVFALILSALLIFV